MHEPCNPNQTLQRFHEINQVDGACCLYSSAWSGVANVAVGIKILFNFDTEKMSAGSVKLLRGTRHVRNTQHTANSAHMIIQH